MDEAQHIDPNFRAVAYALAVLAAEEYGKFQRTVMMSFANNDASDWAKYWDAFKKHEAKLAVFQGQHVDMSDWGPIGTASDREWLDAWNARDAAAGAFHADKMSALYVDYVRGIVQRPDVMISQVDVEPVLDNVGRVVELALLAFPGDLTERLTRSPERKALMTTLMKAKTPDEKEALLPDSLKRAMEQLDAAQSEEARVQAVTKLTAAMSEFFDREDLRA